MLRVEYILAMVMMMAFLLAYMGWIWEEKIEPGKMLRRYGFICTA